MQHFGHNDTLNYNPTKEGLPKASLNLRKLGPPHESERNKTFQFDQYFTQYRKNKLEARKHHFERYYQRSINHNPTVISSVLNIMEKQNTQQFKFTRGEYTTITCRLTGDRLVFDSNNCYLPDRSATHTLYLDAFDALAMQMSEDLVFQSINENYQDEAQILHLCSPNDWSAEQALGKSMSWIHRNIPYIKQLIPNNKKLLQSLLTQNKVFERVGAINLYQDCQLNHHPELKKSNADSSNFYIRFERQTISPIRPLGFLFTIRTYFNDLKKIPHEQLLKIIEGVKCNEGNVNANTSSSSNIDIQDLEQWYRKNYQALP